MKTTIRKTLPVILSLAVAASLPARAQNSDLDDLKAQLKAMQKTMEEMQKKIDQLEKEKTAQPPPAPTPAPTPTPAPGATALEKESPSVQTLEKIAEGQQVGHASPITPRENLNDQQDAAQRPGDLTLDPKYRGFIPVPNTPVLVKFNAKPRVDMTSDTKDSGNPDRFVTAQIPVKGQADFGGSEQFNVNARGSQLRVDVRAPELAGNLRFYYQNDFFGSGSGMSYRLQQMYGQFFNITAGFTYSCFEDPDAWPDTVDFEGPNSAIFARRALVRYMLPLSEAWQLNFGVEAPGAELDGSGTPSGVSAQNPAPDGTMNVRWEDAKLGHVQLGGVLRDIGARGEGVGNQSVLGWGLNLSGSINVLERDSVQGQLTYGEGIFRYINDDFVNNDAAFNTSGDLKAIPCFTAMAGYTHRWSDQFRSTGSFGYVHLDPTTPQGPDAYRRTYYGSLNLVWQARKKLSVGLEGLYGRKEVQSGEFGDVWRVQLGLVYSLFE
jgi:hypothetical protein